MKKKVTQEITGWQVLVGNTIKVEDVTFRTSKNLKVLDGLPPPLIQIYLRFLLRLKYRNSLVINVH